MKRSSLLTFVSVILLTACKSHPGLGTTTSTGTGSGGAGNSASGTGTSTASGGSGPGTGGTGTGGGGGPSGSGCLVPAPTATGPTASGASVAITVDVDTVTCAVAPDFAGTNFEAFSMWGADVSMGSFQQQAFQAARIQQFRYPGGEPAEWSDLLMTGKCKDTSDANWGSPAYTALWAFAKSAGVHSLMLQTNPTPQYCGADAQDSSGAHAAALAADASAHGVNAVFEIGNEPDLGNSFFGKNGGQAAYFAKFIEQASAIHGANPKAEVYGPVVCGLGGNCSFPVTWDSKWIDAFLAQTGDLASGAGKGSADGVSFHVYLHPEWAYSDLTEAKIDKYGFALYWSQTVMPYLRTVIAKHDTRNLPIAVSEISLGNGIPNDPAQTQNMFTVLESVDVFASFASSGLRSFQWFDANAAGPSDYWMITPSKTRPMFYAFLAWAKMGNRVIGTSSDVSPHDVAAYATRKSDGSVQVLLINKTNSSHPVSLAFKGLSPAGKPLAIDEIKPATAGSDASPSILYNGAADPLPSALPAPTLSTATAGPTYTIAPYSLAVLNFGP